MSRTLKELFETLQTRFAELLDSSIIAHSQITLEVPAARAVEVFTALRDEPEFALVQLMDIAGVDYSTYGESEWKTGASSNSGFSRGVNEDAAWRGSAHRAAHPGVPGRRFAAVYQLLSIEHNQRVRVRVFAPDDELPVIPTVTNIWASADWYEREAFDLLGIVFEGHPDLRRILTDYGFVGHPFRKDFPLIGNVEMRYDAERGRVIYQPVSIEPRVLVPRVIRKDSRVAEEKSEPEQEGAADA